MSQSHARFGCDSGPMVQNFASRLAAGTPAGQTAVCTRRTSTRRWRWSTATSRPRWRATRRMRATAERTRIATPAAAGDRRSVRRPPRAPPGPPATDWTCPPSLPTTPRVDNSTARASAPQAVAPRSCSRPPAATRDVGVLGGKDGLIWRIWGLLWIHTYGQLLPCAPCDLWSFTSRLALNRSEAWRAVVGGVGLLHLRRTGC